MTKNNNVVSKILMVIISALLALILYLVQDMRTEVKDCRTDIGLLKIAVAKIETRLNLSRQNELGKIFQKLPRQLD